MPFIGTNKLLDRIGPKTGPGDLPQQKEENKPTPNHSLGSIVDAAFSRENVFVSAFKNGVKDNIITNPDYNPFSSLPNTKYEKYLNSFVYADSDEEVERIKEQIDREENYTKILNESGWVGTVSSIAASLMDPTILIPGTTAIKAARGIKAIEGAALGSTAVGIQEVGLQSTQLTRTPEESALAIAAGGIFGGILGGAFGAVSKSVRESNEGIVNNILSSKSSDINITPGSDGSIGAASVDIGVRLSDEGIARLNENVVKGFTGFVQNKIVRSPIVEGLLSPFPTMRRITNELFEHNIITGKNVKGESSGPSVETLIKLREADIASVQKSIKESYFRYVGIDPNSAFRDIRGLKASASDGKMSYTRFNEEVAKALRRNDTHKIESVQRAAREARKIIDKVTRDLKAAGVLDESTNVKFASSYLSRVYNTEKLLTAEGSNKFIRKVRDHFVRKGLDEDKALEVAQDVRDNIVGVGDKALGLNQFVGVKTKSGKFTKERVLDIPDEEIEEFLFNNAEEIIGKYVTQANHLIEFNNFLKRNGYESADDMLSDLKSDLDQLIKNNPDQSDKLTRDFERAAKLLRDQTEIITGQFGKGKQIKSLQYLRKYQTLRLLGGVLVSSLPDVMMSVFKHGLSATIRDGYLPMIRGLKAAKLSRDQLKDMSVGLELETNNMLKALTDPEYVMGTSRSAVDRLADNALDLFGKASGITYWNNFHKRLAGSVSQARTIRTLEKLSNGKNIPQSETQRLASLGIDKTMYSRVFNQFKRYGEKYDGSYISNIRNWTDYEAAKVFKAATLKDVDSTIITPGRGDISRIAQSGDIGKTIFQFRSFSQAVVNKLIIPGLQRRDANTLQGFMGLLGMGMAVYTLKEKIAGREPSDDPTKLISEGISRSGMTGLMMDTAMGLYPLSISSRFINRNTTSILFGPSSMIAQDFLTDVSRVIQKGVDEDKDISKEDVSKLIKYLPFQNLFYLRVLFDKAKDKGKRDKSK